MRVGRIGYINCYPVYGAIDRGVVPLAADLVTGTPSELNELLAAAELDVSVVSAVEYARNARDYVLLPDLAISCDGPVRSVALFSRRPAVELDCATVRVCGMGGTARGGARRRQRGPSGVAGIPRLGTGASWPARRRRRSCV